MSHAISLSGKMLAFSRLKLHTDNLDDIVQALCDFGSQDRQVALIIQSDIVLDLSALIERLWAINIAVIGVVSGVLDEQALSLKLAIFPEGRSSQLQKTTVEAVDDKPSASLVYEQLVRSGQAVHHLGGGLVLLNGVNAGAEVATDCDLHIYGKAQGRIVAGATGDKSARIFCQYFDPELVCLAGTFCVKNDIPKDLVGQAVWVEFSEEAGLIFCKMP